MCSLFLWKMAISYDKIVDIISTIDDCLMLDEDGTCRVEVVSAKDKSLRISRNLQYGDLFVVVGNDEVGICGYIDRATKNTAASTRAPMSSVDSMEFNTNLPFNDVAADIKSKIREIIKLDVCNARKLV